MPYELVKKLKDAGFPIVEHANKAPEHRTYKTGIPGALDIVYIPTLEELIEACSQGFETLEQRIKEQDYGEDYPPHWEWCANNKKFSCYGSTPSEAVARLWLSLHKQ